MPPDRTPHTRSPAIHAGLALVLPAVGAVRVALVGSRIALMANTIPVDQAPPPRRAFLHAGAAAIGVGLVAVLPVVETRRRRARLDPGPHALLARAVREGDAGGS